MTLNTSFSLSSSQIAGISLRVTLFSTGYVIFFLHVVLQCGLTGICFLLYLRLLTALWHQQQLVVSKITLGLILE